MGYDLLLLLRSTPLYHYSLLQLATYVLMQTGSMVLETPRHLRWQLPSTNQWHIIKSTLRGLVSSGSAATGPLKIWTVNVHPWDHA